MIHFLQCLWWEWRWKRLKAEQETIRMVLPALTWAEDRASVMQRLHRVERDLNDLERRMRVRP